MSKKIPIINGIIHQFKELGRSMSEIQQAKQITKSLKVRVLFVDENNLINEHIGVINQRENSLKVDLLNRQFDIGKYYLDSKLKKVYIVKKGFPQTIDLDRLKVKDGDICSRIAYDISSTKVLEVLEEPSRRTILTAFMFGFTIGLVIALFIAYWIAVRGGVR